MGYFSSLGWRLSLKWENRSEAREMSTDSR